LTSGFTAAWLTATLTSSAAARLFAATLLTAAATGVGFSTRSAATAFASLSLFFFGYHDFSLIFSSSIGFDFRSIFVRERHAITLQTRQTVQWNRFFLT
jgi:hypothetical protein